jgi:hypothetical protein
MKWGFWYNEYMSKHKKKRNKTYTGIGSTSTPPTVTRIQAVNRSPIGQWWFERKKIIKPIAKTTAVVLVVSYLLFELLRIIFGW